MGREELIQLINVDVKRFHAGASVRIRPIDGGVQHLRHDLSMAFDDIENAAPDRREAMCGRQKWTAARRAMVNCFRDGLRVTRLFSHLGTGIRSEEHTSELQSHSDL